MSNAIKNFNILATNLNTLHNYFNSLTKLFSDLYLIKLKIILLNHRNNCVESQTLLQKVLTL